MGYCTVQDLRDEGVADPPADGLLQRRIDLWTAQIDRWTGRWFEPRELTIRVDGAGSGSLLLGPPIISLDSVRIITEGSEEGGEEIALSDLRIYNRHLSGFLDEDDRENPRIEWRGNDLRELDGGVVEGSGGRWPRGFQNVELTGVFGYTDPAVGTDDEETGVTPLLIKHACILLVTKNLNVLADTDAREEVLRSARITSLRTREQSVSYASPGGAGSTTRLLGAFSGDVEIDNIIASFCRQPRLGAA